MQDQMPQNDMNSMPDQGTDREGAMAKADLYKLANYSLKLFKQIQDEDQLEGWVQAKVTKAADYIASVYHYLEYEMKFSDYGDQLDNAGMYSEGQKHALKNKLMEAKEKVKELKKAQAKKADAKEDKKVSEGILSGGDESCTECGGTGVVYREATPVPDHVKGKVEKYNRQAKAFHAASKRIDRNHDGIDDRLQSDSDVAEDFESLKKTGDTAKTSKGNTVTKTDKGIEHTRPSSSYSDEDGDEKSGKGKKSHATARSSADKKGDKSADKQQAQDGKNWEKRFPGSVTKVELGKKVDPNAPKPKKEKEVDETYGQGIYEASKLKGAQKKLDVAEPKGKIDAKDMAALRAKKKVKEAYDEKEEQKHAAKTTMKHVDASDASDKTKAAIKKASKDIKPGSYKDRADALTAANVKEAITVPSSPDGATAPPPKGKDGQYPVITSGPNKGKRWTEKAPGPTNPAFKESVNESADLNRMKELMTRLNG